MAEEGSGGRTGGERGEERRQIRLEESEPYSVEDSRTFDRDAADAGGAGGGGGGGAAAGPGEGNKRVYVGNLSWGVQWQELKDHMRQAGEVIRADVMTEPGGRSKGCGVVEYASADDAAAAISTLNDTELDGRLIFVREDREPEKRVANSGYRDRDGYRRREFDRRDDYRRDRYDDRGGGGYRRDRYDDRDGHRDDRAGGGGAYRNDRGGGGYRDERAGPPECRVYVGNLSYSTEWQSLKDYFRQAGAVAHADVMRDAGHRSKGCGIVEFEDAEGARNAIATLNDTDLDGRSIFVREDREAGRRSGY